MTQTSDSVPADESLYRDYMAGDAAAFDILYRRYREPLYRFLLRSGLSEAVTEDVYQDIWLRVIHRRDVFRGGSFRSWIYRVARNLRIDYLRRATVRAVDKLTDDTGQAPNRTEVEAADLECVELLKRGVAGLAADQRDAFLLKEEAGLALAQIAEVMAVGRETVKSRLRYAMNKLRELLEDCL